MTNQEKMELLIKAHKMLPMEVFENRKDFPDEIVRVMASKDALCSYRYACDVIKGRWEQGEAAISKDPYQSLCYARDVIKGRWEPGEAAIMQSAESSYPYARNVIKGRWEPGEAAIMQSAAYYYLYALEVLKGDLTPEMLEAWESLNAQPV